jgi:hypothetical protein
VLLQKERLVAQMKLSIRRIVILAVVFVFIGAAAAFYANFLRMDFVPGADQFKEWLPEFASNLSDLKGLYGNQDVDSLIFSFRFPGSPERFFSDLENKAQNSGWTIEERHQNYLRLLRFKTGVAMYSYEEVKFVSVPNKSKGYIGYIQIDSPVKVSKLSQTDEGRWADRVLWPKFNRYLEKEGVHSQ